MQSSLIPQSGHFFCFLFPDCSCNFLHTSAKDFQLACSLFRRRERRRGWQREKQLQVHASPISSTNRLKHTSYNFYGALMIELHYIEREKNLADKNPLTCFITNGSLLKQSNWQHINESTQTRGCKVFPVKVRYLAS